MTTYPYASSGKIQSAQDSIGANFIGSQEVTLLKQILVAIGSGGINPPFDPIIITAPDGAYAGALLIITGGVYAVYSDGEYVLALGDEILAVQVYQFVINGVPIGDWATSPTTIPLTVVEGDILQVQDIAGNLSNEIPAIANPDPLTSIPYLRYWYGGKNLGPSTSGLYLDTTCTVPITDEWQLVAGVKYNGQIFSIQPDVASRPMTRKASDGTWLLLFDGLDDWLDPDLNQGGQVTYSVLMRSVTPVWSNYWGPIDEIEAFSVLDARWGHVLMSGVTWELSTPPVSIIRTGVDIPSPFNSAPVDSAACYTVVTNDADANIRQRGIGRVHDYFGNFELAGFFIHIVDPEPTNVTTVDSIFISRIPT